MVNKGDSWLQKKRKFMSNHPYHLVDPSPWPIVASLAALLPTVAT